MAIATYVTLAPITYVEDGHVRQITKAGVLVKLDADQAAALEGWVSLVSQGLQIEDLPRLQVLRYDDFDEFPIVGSEEYLFLAGDTGALYGWSDDELDYLTVTQGGADSIGDATTYAKDFLTTVDDAAEARSYIGLDNINAAELAWIARHPGRPVPTARIAYYDHPDTAFASLPTMMDTGQTGVTYEDNGTNHPFIEDGAFQLPRGSGSGQAFEYTHVDAGVGNQLTRLAATFKIDPTGASTDTWAIGIAMANGPTLDFGGTAYRIGLHLSIGATQWGLSKVSNATGTKVFTFMTDVNGDQTAGFLQSTMIEDDMAEYTVEIWRVGNTAVIVLPDGQRIEVTDSDIGAWSGRYGYIELVMVARDTDPFPKFTEAWHGANGITLPGQGGVVTREVLDGNINPKISTIRGVNGTVAALISAEDDAVNYVGIANRVDGSPPYLYAGGIDADIDIGLVAKNKGRVRDGITGRPFAQTPDGATVLTTNTAPTRNRITRYNATAGNIAVTLSALSGLVDGDTYPVQKYSGDASANTITFTCAGTDTFDDGSTTSLVLRVTSELRTLQAFSIAGALHWKVVGGNTTLSSLDARYVQPSGNVATATALATARNIDGQAFDGTAAITVIAPGAHAASSKTTPVDADEIPLVDSAAANVLKKLTWANLKAAIATYYNTLVATMTNKTLAAPRVDYITDINGNPIVLLSPTTSAVNYVDIANAAAGSGPLIFPVGADPNIDLNFAGLGTGKPKIGGVAIATTGDVSAGVTTAEARGNHTGTQLASTISDLGVGVVGSDDLTLGESTISRRLITATNVGQTTGALRLTYFTAKKTETTTSVRLGTGTTAAAATPTLARVGIYTVAANGDIALVASTPNDTALFAAASTFYTKALSVPLSKVRGQRYAVGVLVVTGTTAPNLQGQNTITNTEMGQAPRLGGLMSGQTDLPASALSAAVSDNSHIAYVALVP